MIETGLEGEVRCMMPKGFLPNHLPGSFLSIFYHYQSLKLCRLHFNHSAANLNSFNHQSVPGVRSWYSRKTCHMLVNGHQLQRERFVSFLSFSFLVDLHANHAMSKKCIDKDKDRTDLLWNSCFHEDKLNLDTWFEGRRKTRRLVMYNIEQRENLAT